MDKYLLLIDGSSLLSTQFFGNLPPEVMFAKTDEEKAKYFHKIMQTSKGVYTNGVYGFMRSLMRILKDQKPSYLAVAWDISRNTFRRELYPDYKGNRSETMVPLKDQFSLCQEVLKRIGVPQFMDERFEADDFCGSLAARFENEVPVRIMTKDNDYLQLVTENTNLWLIHATAKKTDELYAKYKIVKDSAVAADRSFPLTPELVKAEFGVEPASIPDLKGLQGDTSDNIKGVKGVGPATAVALIAKYKTVEALYEAMEGLDDKQLKELAVSWKEIGISRSPLSYLLKNDENELVGKDAAFLSKKLATIKKDIDLGTLTIDDLCVNIDASEAVKVFDELEFKSLKPDFGTADAPVSSFIYTSTGELAKVEDIVDALTADSLDGSRHEGKHVGFSLIADDEGIMGIALTTAEGTTVVKTEGFITGSYISDMLTRIDDSGVCLAGFDIKSELKYLECLGFLDAFDASVAQYLLEPLSGVYDPASVYTAVTGQLRQSRSDVLGKASLREMFESAPEAVLKIAALESDSAYACYEPLNNSLKETGMDKLFYEIEMPLIYTLSGMEKCGVLVRPDLLKQFEEYLSGEITELEKEIYKYVGEEFNINSPKQLGCILFEKLRLPYGKKTKSGYSTSADVLEKLKSEDPVVEKILDYRQLTKLKSTYATGLFQYICADGRIRTTFNQMVTATGRLSSTDPNLQNIPIRTELGRELRKVFVPSEGCVFVDADYSQIELRILAALSGDGKLISAYRDAQDIHRATASAVFHVPYDEVSSELRSRAKAVNFGIVYGISSFGLGNNLNISKKEAEQYINDYFAIYPQIKNYIDGLISEAKDKGYAVTAFGRRRPIPELSSSNFMQRQFGERVAMNSPIQGTAADIIKIAMIHVDARLRKELPAAKLVLQVHDELLVETPKEYEEQVRAILIEEMRNAAELKVSLEVGIESGNDWFEAH